MKKALKIVGNVILWLFVAFSAITMVFSLSAASNSDGIPGIFGKSMITVQSNSMKPTFKKGDLIIDKPLKGVEKMTLKVGDVITFKIDLDGDGKDELNTHRIVAVVDANGNPVADDYYVNNHVYYRTQGDNKTTNPDPDKTLVRHDMVVGKYTDAKVAGMGNVLDFLQSSTGFLVVIVIPLALFFLYELYNVISTVVATRQKKLTASEEEELKRKAVEEYLRQQKALAEGAEAKESSADEEKPQEKPEDE